MIKTSTHRANFRLAMFGATALAVFFSTAVFSQGNSGNGGGSGKPPVSSLGLGKLPMWSLSGNATDSTAIFGTTNNMPIRIVVNSIHRGSFTNTGFDIYGNSHSTSALVDSILTSWQVMVNDVLSVTGNINAGGDIILSTNSSVRNAGNASLTFDGFGNSNVIGLGYNINTPDSAEGLVVIPKGNSQYPNGAVLLGDASPDGEILITLDGSSGGRLNIRGWEKKTYLVNDGGEKITLDGVNGISTWETTKGLTIATRSGTTFTDNYHLNIQGNLNSQQFYQNDTLVDLVNLQTTVANIKSSQWQNDTVNPSNIFYSSGNVGIGTSEPSVPLEVSGSIKITGSDTTGSGGGGGGGGGIPPPAPSRSIIIDGGLDRIIATSGTLDFVNTNLTTTGNLQTNSITTTNITITDFIKTKSAEFDTLKVAERFEAQRYIQSDTMHALSSLEVNNSLRLKRDTSVMYAEMSTKDTAVALMLQKEPTAPVVIGDAPAPPPGESRAKLTVIGNTKLDGSVNVSGNISAAGMVSANTFNAKTFSSDSLFVTRILPAVGDSEVHIGDSTIIFNPRTNSIYTGFCKTIPGSPFVCDGSLYIQSQPIPNPLPFGWGGMNTILNRYTGRVGIGTANPGAEVEIYSSGSFHGNTLPIVKTNGSAGAGWRFIAGTKEWAVHATGTANLQGTDKMVFKCISDSTTPITLISTGPSASGGVGKVGIGTTNPESILQVQVTNDADNAFSVYKGTTPNFRIKGNGVTYARDVFIYAETETIPDYVFAENYSLAGWDNERNHWKKHHHLLGMPSAKDVEKEGAFNVKEFQLGTLKKLEELFLYVDELKKENENLKREIEMLKNK